MNLTNSLLIIFTIIALGFVCGRKKLFNDSQIEGFELFLFKIAIPSYLFSSALNYEFSELINVAYVLSYLISFAIIAFLIFIIFRKNDSINELAIKILSASYVNAAMYALPVITFILGSPNAAILSNLIQVIIIQPIFITILNFIYFKQKSTVRKILSSIFTPIVIMPLLGMIMNYFKVGSDLFLTIAITNLGNGIGGITLFTFGLSLSGIKIDKNIFHKHVLILTFIKNIIHPIVGFIVGNYIFNLDKYWLNSLIIVTSAPTAFVIYLFAKQYGVEQNLTRIIIACSSVISLITLTFLTFIIN